MSRFLLKLSGGPVRAGEAEGRVHPVSRFAGAVAGVQAVGVVALLGRF